MRAGVHALAFDHLAETNAMRLMLLPALLRGAAWSGARAPHRQENIHSHWRSVFRAARSPNMPIATGRAVARRRALAEAAVAPPAGVAAAIGDLQLLIDLGGTVGDGNCACLNVCDSSPRCI